MVIVCRTFVDSERFFVSLQSKSSGEYYTLGLRYCDVTWSNHIWNTNVSALEIIVFQ